MILFTSFLWIETMIRFQFWIFFLCMLWNIGILIAIICLVSSNAQNQNNCYIRFERRKKNKSNLFFFCAKKASKQKRHIFNRWQNRYTFLSFLNHWLNCVTVQKCMMYTGETKQKNNQRFLGDKFWSTFVVFLSFTIKYREECNILLPNSKLCSFVVSFPIDVAPINANQSIKNWTKTNRKKKHSSPFQKAYFQFIYLLRGNHHKMHTISSTESLSEWLFRSLSKSKI